MNPAVWDGVLDEIEHAVALVEQALDAGEPIPELPPFEPPSDVMPPLSSRQRDRAEALMQRQASVEVRVSAEIVSAQLDLGQLRRRRKAALAYSRG